MRDLQKAREILQTGEHTCVLYHNNQYMTTTLRGVKPLVKWLQEGNIAPGFSAADKVVGKATAFLYCLLGAKAVYANVMSRCAQQVLQDHGIYAQCAKLTEYIENRAKDGICPFEAAVMDINRPEDALDVIRGKMEQMGISV